MQLFLFALFLLPVIHYHYSGNSKYPYKFSNLYNLIDHDPKCSRYPVFFIRQLDCLRAAVFAWLVVYQDDPQTQSEALLYTQIAYFILALTVRERLRLELVWLAKEFFMLLLLSFATAAALSYDRIREADAVVFGYVQVVVVIALLVIGLCELVVYIGIDIVLTVRTYFHEKSKLVFVIEEDTRSKAIINSGVVLKTHKKKIFRSD